MSDEPPPADGVEAVAVALARKLAAYAETLDGQQRGILERLAYRAMDPLDRMALTAPPDLLDAAELETLRRIEEGG